MFITITIFIQVWNILRVCRQCQNSFFGWTIPLNFIHTQQTTVLYALISNCKVKSKQIYLVLWGSGHQSGRLQIPVKAACWTDLKTGWHVTAQCLSSQTQLPGLLWNANQWCITGQYKWLCLYAICLLHPLEVQTHNHLKVFFFTAGTISMLTSISRSNFRVKHSLLGS